VIIFDSLTEEDLRQIVDLLLSQVNENLKSKRITIELTEDARKWIIDVTCSDRSYGARPLRRAIQKYIEDPVSELIIQGKLKDNEVLTVYWKKDALYYRNSESKMEGALFSYDLV
jgi:ATP-dependent Clp protease ATP-binding subunit ClpC